MTEQSTNKFGLPEKLNAFNVYSYGTKLIGVSDEVKLPEITEITSTISGPGILGELESPTVGKFQASDFDLPFRTLYRGATNVLAEDHVDLTLRGSTQIMHGAGEVTYESVRVVIRGRKKGFNPGTFKQGEGTNASVKVEWSYFLLEIGGKKCLEIDKVNERYKVNGVDKLAVIKAMC